MCVCLCVCVVVCVCLCVTSLSVCDVIWLCHRVAITLAIVEATLTTLRGTKARLNNAGTRKNGLNLISEQRYQFELFARLRAFGGCLAQVDAEVKIDHLRLDLEWVLPAGRQIAIEMSAHCSAGRPTERASVAGHVQRLAHDYLVGGLKGCMGVMVHLGVDSLEGRLRDVLSRVDAVSGGDVVHRLYVQVNNDCTDVLSVSWWAPGIAVGTLLYPTAFVPRLGLACTVTTGIALPRAPVLSA